jgi:hypothetical protein
VNYYEPRVENRNTSAGPPQWSGSGCLNRSPRLKGHRSTTIPRIVAIYNGFDVPLDRRRALEIGDALAALLERESPKPLRNIPAARHYRPRVVVRLFRFRWPMRLRIAPKSCRAGTSGTTSTPLPRSEPVAPGDQRHRCEPLFVHQAPIEGGRDPSEQFLREPEVRVPETRFGPLERVLAGSSGDDFMLLLAV